MTKTAGRPKGKNNKVLMAFRFRRDMAETIRKLAAQNDLPQGRILEILITRFSKDMPAIQLSNCCEPSRPHLTLSANGSEQNPQVPLASEDAFAQVPGNAETAVGTSFRFATKAPLDFVARPSPAAGSGGVSPPVSGTGTETVPEPAAEDGRATNGDSIA